MLCLSEALVESCDIAPKLDEIYQKRTSPKNTLEKLYGLE